jgi:hypothetical protein
MTPQPATPARCHFCGSPSTQVLGIRPTCDRCAPAVKEIRARNLEAMLTFFRDVAKRDQVKGDQAA